MMVKCVRQVALAALCVLGLATVAAAQVVPGGYINGAGAARGPVTFALGTEPASPVEGMFYYNAAEHQLYVYNGSTWVGVGVVGAGLGTVTSAALTMPNLFSIAGTPITSAGTFAVTFGAGTLPAANGGLGAASLSGILIGNGASAATAVTTSAGIIAALSDETGTGAAVFGTSPTLVTPALGTPSALVATNASGTAASLTSGITLGLKSASTTVNVSAATAPSTGQCLIATDSTHATWQTCAAGSGDALTTNPLSQFAATTSAQLAGVVSDETGTGAVVLATSPTLVTPALGTPSAAVLTNATGLPIATGVSGLATGVATALATPSSANLITAVTDETGTGALVFGTSPTLVTPILGTPTSGTLTNATGLPISTGVSGLGTGVATALATPSSANLKTAITDETGSGALVFATSPTLVTPLLGTPTSGVMTNVTGTASGLTAGNATAALGIASATTTVSVSAATAPTSGQCLTASSTTLASWVNCATISGSGMVLATSGALSAVSTIDPTYLPTAVTYTAITGTTSIATCGGIYLATGTSADYAVTLPAASGTNGCSIYLKMGIPAALTKLVTVTAAGGDLIEQRSGAAPAATVVMWAGEYCGFVADGVSLWRQMGCRAIPMRAVMQRQANQSIPDNTETKVLLDTSVLNIGSMADAVTTKMVTIRRAGTYSVHACWYASSGTGQIRVDKNTSTEVLNGNSQVLSNGQFPIIFAAGDTVQLNVLQVSGGALNTYASSEACIAPSLSVFEEN